MLFQVTHTHTHETCPARSNEALKPYTTFWQSMKNTPGIKVLGGYVSPMNHTFHITVDADDYSTLARALGPLNVIGTGQTTPVIPLDDAIPLAEAGAFR